MSVLRSSDVSAPEELGSGKTRGGASAVFAVARLAALLYIGVLLPALVLKWLTARYPEWGQTGAALLKPESRELWETIAIGVGVLLALAAPRFGGRRFAAIERAFSRFAVQRTQAILAAAVFPVVVRLALLPLIPMPQPWVPDEFGHLLLADTLASGRITNPTHPMWRHFETLYVLHQPTYTSQYPIAQGALLAVAEVFHLAPWFGVCLSMGLMGAALCWMLQGWLPPKWALLGALLAGARWSIASYWMNSYWGGAAGAIGGALLLGALPRLLKPDRARPGQALNVLLAGAGLLVLSQSRPFEGLMLSLPVGALLLARLLGNPREHARLLAALAGVAAVTVGFALYYDWRVTGHALEMPYQLHKQIYGTPQNLLWSRPVMTAARVKEQRDIWDNFEWQLGLFQKQSSWEGFATAFGDKLKSFWEFYFQPILTLPLLLLPLILRRRDFRFLFLTTVFVLLAGFLLYPFFFAHYAAPLTGALLALMLQGARYLRTLRWPHERFGAALFRWGLVTAGAASCAALALGSMLCPACVSTGATARSRVADELKQRGGKHLVLVRYSAAHDFNYPWISNSASIDSSPVIWARELGQAGVAELLHRYPGREAWLVNADDPNPQLILYEDKDRPLVSAILNAAGKSPFFKEGVTPGSIVTLFGMKFGIRESGPSPGETCLIPAAPGGAQERRRTALTGFDGSRPGIPIPQVDERIPAMTLQTAGIDRGAVFSLAAGSGGGRDPVDDQGLSVRFGNLNAAVLCESNTAVGEAVTVLVPPELAGAAVNLVVRSGGNESKSQTIPVLPANPGILQTVWLGRPAAVILHANGELATPMNPGRRGEIVRMFVTGAGAPAENGPPYPFIVGVNNRGATLVGINCAGCGGGIVELRFEIPKDAPSGDAIPLSAAVVVKGTPAYSNGSALAIR